jgi:hypothetical protein
VTFERARAIADAVLLEGYALYPYRPSSVKNQFRWPFGVLAPHDWSDAGGAEAWWLETQCVLEGAAGGRIDGRLRFLQTGRIADRAWDEGRLVEVDFSIAAADGAEAEIPFVVEGRTEDRVGVTWSSSWICGVVRARIAAAPEHPELLRLTVRVENGTPWDDPRAPRDRVLGSSCLSSHLLLSTTAGRFLSFIDPPSWAAAAIRGCHPVRSFPVLTSETDDLVLAAPIILYDHPRVAPESPQDLFDGTEIDEILTLRTRTLTDEEKAEARAWDPRVAALLDRADGLGPDSMASLHGTFRDIRNGEMVPREGAPRNDPDAARAAGIEPGARVTLRPHKGTDAQDLLYAGMSATVEAVVRDVGGEPHLLVTIDGDPAADLHRWYGRFHYYRLDEVER